MQASRLKIERRPEQFDSDDRRVIARFFTPNVDARIRAIINRVLAMPEKEVAPVVQELVKDFGARHRKIEEVFLRHFKMVQHEIDHVEKLSDKRKMLIGAYFTMEYSVESAALFNPSIVKHPDQSGLKDDELRFIMSLRATGEGHVSSIVFRTGVIGSNGALNHITFDPPSRYARQARQVEDRKYDRHLFYLKLIEMGAFNNDYSGPVFEHLGEYFTLAELENAIELAREAVDDPTRFAETAENMRWLAHSNYHLEMPGDADPSEIVIFPTSENESKGLEDVRLVRFVDRDESVRYFGTYTAYNGFRILPQLLETKDFTRVEVHTLNGRYVQNKGMALFPRRVDDWYMMVSRLDGESMYLMRSDNVHFWNECMPLQAPRYAWEFVQIGNCGSPLATPEGWLLLTHGVGPMRRYCIGATLLDLDDPSRIIGHLKEPLIVPDESERDGYVPNVVYSCGAIIHNDELVIPYGVSDVAVKCATTSLPELLKELTT